MAIKGLTDRQTLRPALPRLGKLRKGSKRPAGGKRPGKDLDHFRFTSDRPEVEAAFADAYGDKPRFVNVLLWGATTEEVFPNWIEAWDGSGLVFRSDGERWVVWRNGDRLSTTPRPHEDHPDQVEVGRLSFLIPELLQAGLVGTVTLETHSKHDLRNITAVLLAAEEQRGTLHGTPLTIRRSKERIGTPGFGDREGQRSQKDVWLVRLEVPPAMFAPQLVEERAQLKAGDAPLEIEAPVEDPGESPPPPMESITNPQAAVDAINAALGKTRYNAPQHLFNAIRQDDASFTRWPGPDDADGWEQVIASGVRHARAGEVEQEELPF